MEDLRNILSWILSKLCASNEKRFLVSISTVVDLQNEIEHLDEKYRNAEDFSDEDDDCFQEDENYHSYR